MCTVHLPVLHISDIILHIIIIIVEEVKNIFYANYLSSVRDEDFMINDTELTLYHQGNMTLVCLELVIINDLFIEDLERFAIEVAFNNPNDGLVLGYNRTEISIEDNDCKLLGNNAV